MASCVACGTELEPPDADPMYAITLHQPWASLIALGLKTVETRSWPAPARLVGQRIAVHAGKRLVRQPGERIERELRVHWGDDWRLIIYSLLPQWSSRCRYVAGPAD